MRTNYYSIGTARYDRITSQAIIIAKATKWLLQQQNTSGTWAGPDSLDEFVSTTHSTMALMVVGFAPDSARITPTMKFLVNLDKDKHLSFYWRSGAFLNLPEYRDIVCEDAKYVWAFRDRVAVHRDYPVHFFLLKLLRFGDLEGAVEFSVRDVLQRILADWNADIGWYNRTSITSMAVALIYNLTFPNKNTVIQKAVQYIVQQFKAVDADSGKFHNNLVDDAFLVFNLCETDFLGTPVAKPLIPLVEKVVNRLLRECQEDKFWVSEPPFGGAVSDHIYPTAVVIRALMAFYAKRIPDFLAQVASHLAEESAVAPPLTAAGMRLEPFWGDILHKEDADLCFILMPFSPPELTEIYERYVKAPIESLGIRCKRADDIYRSSHVMNDIWEYINRATVIVAELTNKNANVFYELGMAHVLGKKVILISQSEEVIPFDLRGVRQILYKDTPSGYEKLAIDIKRFVDTVLKERKGATGEI